jgi:sirohydrochlorin ferrochelatase
MQLTTRRNKMFRSGFKMKMCIVFILLCIAMLFVSPVCAAEENIGVLVVAHGSDESSWNETVQQAVGEVDLSYPLELGFLEFTEPDIHAAVKKLEERGVNKIIAVPLFVSSYSNHIEEIKYVLGLRDTLPEGEESAEGHGGEGEPAAEEEVQLTPVVTQAEIVLTPALDDHVMVAGILADRLKTVSGNPAGEVAILVGHGSDTEEGQQKWRETFSSLAGRVKDLLDLKDAGYGFALMGEPAVRESVEQAVNQGDDVLVAPVMLSEGYFTDTVIPNMLLNGLDYSYPGTGNRALLPHSNIARFIELRVNDVILPPLEINKGDGLYRINYTDVALEEDGKICLCGSFVFHAMQVAFEQLWADEVPRQEDIYVLAYNPSDGTEHALSIIAGGGNYSIDQTVDEAILSTSGLYTYRVTNKATGRSVSIEPGPEVFAENFFSLRAKVKDGTATAEEKQEFQGLRSQVEEKLRWQPAGEILGYQSAENPLGEGTGVLVVAHGSTEDWNRIVQQEIAKVELPFPLELAFLESDEQGIHAMVQRLEEQGVGKIIAVPLFICSYSSHIEEIKYILGLTDTLPGAEEAGEGEVELTPVETRAEIVLTAALDDHIMVAATLAERLEALSQNPGEEIAVLVGHGTSEAEGLQKWTENLSSLSGQLKALINFKDVKYSFVGVGAPTVHDVVSQSVDQGNVLVMPVMLSEGYFTGTKIPNELTGLNHRYPEPGNRALLPHPNIAHFVELSVNDEALMPLQVNKGGDLCRISYTDVALEQDGKICLCGSFVFHAMQVAFEQLWANEVPRQEDIYVLAYNPSDGTEHALSIIAGDNNYSVDQTIDEAILTTPDLYTYKVTNKATGRSVLIKPGTEVFPDNFFSLRAKVKDGTATAAEKQEFQGLRSQVEEKLRWRPAAEILTYKLVSDTGSGSGGGGGGSSSSRPEVGVYVPAKGSTGIGPDAEVSITFNMLVAAVSDASLGGIAIKDAAGNEVGGVTGTLSDKNLTLSHDAFDSGVKYTVTIPAGSVKRQGTSSSNYYNREIKWSFTIGEQEAAEETEEAEPEESARVEVESEMPYSDVSAGYWAAGDITKLYREGIMTGYPDNTFRPESNITRAEFAVLLAKAVGWQSTSAGLDFSDAGDIPAWAGGSIAAAVEKGVISGYGDGSFKSHRPVTRAEMAVMTVRAMGKQIDPAQPEVLSFSDNSAIQGWAKGYVAEALEQGIVKGKPGNLFAPGDSATRAEAAAVIAKMMVNMGK